MPRIMVIKLHYILGGVAALVVLAALVGLLNGYLGARVNNGSTVKQGETYTVHYKTSKDAPAVNVELCHDDPSFCVPVAEKDSDGEVTLVVPANFPVGKATVNVLDLGKNLALNGNTQKSVPLTVARLSGSNLTAAQDGAQTSGSAASSAASGLAALFHQSATTGTSTSTTTSSSSSSTSTSTVIIGETCPTTACPANPPTATCPDGSRQVLACTRLSATVCGWTPQACSASTGNSCTLADCNIPVNTTLQQTCPDGSRRPLSCVRASNGLCGIPECPTTTPTPTPWWQFLLNTPTPTPQVTPIPVHFYSITLYYSFYVSGQAHLVADVLWQQQPGVKLLYRSDKESTWHSDNSGYIGHARLDLTNIGVGYDQYFWIQARDANNSVLTPEYKYFTSHPDPGENQLVLPGQN